MHTPWPTASIALREALSLLQDGEWHDVDEVIRKVMLKVEPGKAVRTAERTRRNAANQHGNYAMPEVRKFELPTERLVEIGARQKAYDTLHNKRWFERDTQEGRRRIRIRPELLPLQSDDGQ